MSKKPTTRRGGHFRQPGNPVADFGFMGHGATSHGMNGEKHPFGAGSISSAVPYNEMLQSMKTKKGRLHMYGPKAARILLKSPFPALNRKLIAADEARTQELYNMHAVRKVEETVHDKKRLHSSEHTYHYTGLNIRNTVWRRDKYVVAALVGLSLTGAAYATGNVLNDINQGETSVPLSPNPTQTESPNKPKPTTAPGVVIKTTAFDQQLGQAPLPTDIGLRQHTEFVVPSENFPRV